MMCIYVINVVSASYHYEMGVMHQGIFFYSFEGECWKALSIYAAISGSLNSPVDWIIQGVEIFLVFLRPREKA
jgi:hypothetical protein